MSQFRKRVISNYVHVRFHDHLFIQYFRNLTCEAQNSAESIPSRATIQIHVEYAPHVTLQYQPHKLQVNQLYT